MIWKKLKEELVYDGFRKMIRRTFERPDGWEIDFDIKYEEDAVCIFALTKDQKVILAKQFRPGPEKTLIELPGGGIDAGEYAREAAEREFFEETGYRGELQFVGKSYVCAYSTRQTNHFIALDCHKVAEPKQDPDEVTEVVLMDIDDFLTHLRTGKLTDTATAYRCLDRLGFIKK